MTDDGEGSVFVEGFDDDVDESTSESDDSQADTSSSEQEGQQEKSETEEKETKSTNDQEQKDEKSELTEKGTKLDSNPLSRVNQELANERAKIREYEKVLNDPTLLKSYVAQFEKAPKEQEAPKTQEKEMREEDVKTTEDLHIYLKQQNEKLSQKMKELDSTIQTVKSSQKEAVIANTISNDIATVRETYPELDPKSESYNADLDASVGAMYELIDYDKESKQFRGNVKITDIANIIMKASGSSKQKGLQEAQTIVKDKRSGKVTSGSSSHVVDITNMTPSQIIASRIKSARGSR